MNREDFERVSERPCEGSDLIHWMAQTATDRLPHNGSKFMILTTAPVAKGTCFEDAAAQSIAFKLPAMEQLRYPFTHESWAFRGVRESRCSNYIRDYPDGSQSFTSIGLGELNEQLSGAELARAELRALGDRRGEMSPPES